MALPLAGRADATVGNAIEAAVTMEHRRRLRRLRWERALEPPDDGLWAAGDPAPRQGCSLDVLVDGAQALPAIAEALLSARRFVYVHAKVGIVDDRWLTVGSANLKPTRCSTTPR